MKKTYRIRLCLLEVTEELTGELNPKYITTREVPVALGQRVLIGMVTPGVDLEHINWSNCFSSEFDQKDLKEGKLEITGY